MTNTICLECISRGLCRMAGVEQEGIQKCRGFYKDALFMPDVTPSEQLAKSQALVNQPKYPLNEAFDAMLGKKMKPWIIPSDQSKPPRKLNCDLNEWPPPINVHAVKRSNKEDKK